MSESESETANMWADMLGIGPILQAVKDPAFHGQIKGFVATLAATQAACQRIEANQLLIMRALNVGPPAVSSGMGSDGGLAIAGAAGGAADDGTGSPAATSGAAGNRAA